MKNKIIFFLSTLVVITILACNNTKEKPNDDNGKITSQVSEDSVSITVSVLNYDSPIQKIPFVNVVETDGNRELATYQTFQDGTITFQNVSSTNNFRFSKQGYEPVDIVFKNTGFLSSLDISLKPASTGPSPAPNISGYVTEFTVGVDSVKVWYNETEYVETNRLGRYEILPNTAPPFTLKFGDGGEYAAVLVSDQDTAVIVSIDMNGVDPIPTPPAEKE